METVHYSNGAGYPFGENSDKWQKHTLFDSIMDSWKVSRTEGADCQTLCEARAVVTLIHNHKF